MLIEGNPFCLDTVVVTQASIDMIGAFQLTGALIDERVMVFLSFEFTERKNKYHNDLIKLPFGVSPNSIFS